MKALVIFYVASQERSKLFYKSVFEREPLLDVPGMTEFFISEHLLLGLMPESGIATILGDKMPAPQIGNGIPRAELYIFVPNPHAHYERAIANGAKPISELQIRNWGDEVAYCADPDGHILAFASLPIKA